MTDEQATPAHFFHPLFAGMVPSLIDAPCASTFQRLAQGLGFMSACERIPHGLDAFPEAVQRYLDDGYKLAARWQVARADVLLYLKPTTVFAHTIWLAGLGAIEQARPRSVVWKHNAADKALFKGRHETREAAVADGQAKALEQGRRSFVVSRFVVPFASVFVAAEDVLEQMNCRAADQGGDPAESFPGYGIVDKQAMEDALSLLVDGWAAATGNLPEFAVDDGVWSRHDVFDPRSLAP